MITLTTTCLKRTIRRKMDRILGNLKNPGAHAHVLCFVLQFSLWYNILDSVKRAVRASTTEDYELSNARSENNKSIELWPVSEIGNLAIYNIPALKSISKQHSQCVQRIRPLYRRILLFSNEDGHGESFSVIQATEATERLLQIILPVQTRRNL